MIELDVWITNNALTLNFVVSIYKGLGKTRDGVTKSTGKMFACEANRKELMLLLKWKHSSFLSQCAFFEEKTSLSTIVLHNSQRLRRCEFANLGRPLSSISFGNKRVKNRNGDHYWSPPISAHFTYIPSSWWLMIPRCTEGSLKISMHWCDKCIP